MHVCVGTSALPSRASANQGQPTSNRMMHEFMNTKSATSHKCCGVLQLSGTAVAALLIFELKPDWVWHVCESFAALLARLLYCHLPLSSNMLCVVP